MEKAESTSRRRSRVNSNAPSQRTAAAAMALLAAAILQTSGAFASHPHHHAAASSIRTYGSSPSGPLSSSAFVNSESSPQHPHAALHVASSSSLRSNDDTTNVTRPDNPFCYSPTCDRCFEQSSDPKGRILNDYCASLMAMLKRGGTNINVQLRREGRTVEREGTSLSSSSSPSDAESLGYPYVPPFHSLAFHRPILTRQCAAVGRRSEAFETAYGIDTASLAMAVVAAKLVCEDESAAMTEFFLKANAMPAGVPILGCKGYVYNGYRPTMNQSMLLPKPMSKGAPSKAADSPPAPQAASSSSSSQGSAPQPLTSSNHNKNNNNMPSSSSSLEEGSSKTTAAAGVDTYPALRDCFVSNLFSNSHTVPDIFSDQQGATSAFPQGTPNLYATAMKALAVHVNKPSLSLLMIQRLMPALQAMMVATPRREGAKVPVGFGLVIETPNATVTHDSGDFTNGLVDFGSEGVSAAEASPGRSRHRSQSIRVEEGAEAGVPTFHPGPGVFTMTRTRSIVPDEPNTTDEETTTEDEPTTTDSTTTEKTSTSTTATTTRPTSTAAPTTTSSTTTSTTTSTAAPNTTTTSTAAPTTTTAAPTTTTAEPTTTTTQPTTTTAPLTTQPTLPPVTTSPAKFQNSILLLSQACLYQWARNLRNAFPAPAIPQPVRDFLTTILDAYPKLLEPFLCGNMPDMDGLATAFPRRLHVARVAEKDVTDPSQNIFEGYQTVPDLVFDSDTQFGIIAALGSRGLTVGICGNPAQTSFAIDRLLATLDYLAVRDHANNDPHTNLLGIATSDPHYDGRILSARPDAMTTAMAVIALQQVLGDLEGGGGGTEDEDGSANDDGDENNETDSDESSGNTEASSSTAVGPTPTTTTTFATTTASISTLLTAPFRRAVEAASASSTDNSENDSDLERRRKERRRRAAAERHRRFLKSIATQIAKAKNYLSQLRNAPFMTHSNCVIRPSAFWPPYYNSSYGTMTAMAGNAYQCGGETPSLEGTAMWLMAVSGTNPFKLEAGLHPPPPGPDDGDGARRWFEENRVLFLSLCGGVAFVVLAAVLSLIIANSKRRRKRQEEEEDRRALVNPQVLAAQQRQQQQNASSGRKTNGVDSKTSGRGQTDNGSGHWGIGDGGSRYYNANASGSSSPNSGVSMDSGREEKKNMGFF